MGEQTDFERDYLGDQIGWAVRELIPPKRELYKLDQALMRALPRAIARTVALIKFNRGWLPEKGDPLEMYNEFSKKMGGVYLERFADGHHINTLVMDSVGLPIKIHSRAYQEGQRETIMQWGKQVSWAQTINDRTRLGQQIHSEDAVEAASILQLQTEITKFEEALKPRFIKRGFPLPPALDARPTINTK